MRSIARAVNGVSGGRITPNQVTIVSLLAHFGVGWAIIQQRLVLAGLLLIVFGLMDALDGELARLQHRESPGGVVLDASADRYKEGIIFGALAVYFAQLDNAVLVGASVMALAASFLISFVKAKGEAVLAASAPGKSAVRLNRELGKDTFFRFEIRMALIVIGLLSGWLAPVLYLLAAGGVLAGWLRYMEVERRLRSL
jgi:CDP-diacylglycerol--glycerol-3-phosphate 3-phosphatidyltransferase